MPCHRSSPLPEATEEHDGANQRVAGAGRWARAPDIVRSDCADRLNENLVCFFAMAPPRFKAREIGQKPTASLAVR